MSELVSTYLTKVKFDQGCMFTMNQRDWCTSADGLRSVRPGSEPGNARFIVREKRDAKTAAIIGRDHTDFACCANHLFNYVDCSGETGWEPIEGHEIYKVANIVFANA